MSDRDPSAGAAAGVRFFDSHCHLDHDRSAAPLDETLESARSAGVGGMVTVGCDAASSKNAIAVAARHDDVWATVGLHPHDAVNGVDSILPYLDAPKVVAVGECGLDYHYDHSPRDVQRAAFAAQIQLAASRRLPLVIHTRSAWDDTFDILRAEGAPEHTIFHCFSGGPDEARRCLDLGAYLSFSGIVTFPSAPELREAAALCPEDRLLVETDAPYLAPVPFRGRRNEPAHVAVVAAAVAEARHETTQSVAAITWRNSVIAFWLTDS
jgi:TatD DNase family protein